MGQGDNMTDKTFEEMFPSLKGKEEYLFFRMNGKDWNHKIDKNNQYDLQSLHHISFKKDDIMKHCLDKQKVRDAIDKHFNSPDCVSSDDYEDAIEDFKKELGL